MEKSYNELEKLQKESYRIKILIQDLQYVVKNVNEGNIIELPEYYDLYITSIKLRVNIPDTFRSFGIESKYNIDINPFVITNETFGLYNSDEDNYTEIFSNQYAPLKYNNGMKFVFNEKNQNVFANYDLKIEFKNLWPLKFEGILNENFCLFQFYRTLVNDHYYTIQDENKKIIIDVKSNGFLQNILFKFEGDDKFDDIERITLL